LPWSGPIAFSLCLRLGEVLPILANAVEPHSGAVVDLVVVFTQTCPDLHQEPAPSTLRVCLSLDLDYGGNSILIEKEMVSGPLIGATFFTGDADLPGYQSHLRGSSGHQFSGE